MVTPHDVVTQCLLTYVIVVFLPIEGKWKSVGKLTSGLLRVPGNGQHSISTEQEISSGLGECGRYSVLPNDAGAYALWPFL